MASPANSVGWDAVRGLLSQVSECADEFESFMEQQLGEVAALHNKVLEDRRALDSSTEDMAALALEKAIALDNARSAGLEAEVANLQAKLKAANSQPSLKDDGGAEDGNEEDGDANIKAQHESVLKERDHLRSDLDEARRRYEDEKRASQKQREAWTTELDDLRRAVEEQLGQSPASGERPESAPPESNGAGLEKPSPQPVQDASSSNRVIDSVVSQFQELQSTISAAASVDGRNGAETTASKSE